MFLFFGVLFCLSLSRSLLLSLLAYLCVSELSYVRTIYDGRHDETAAAVKKREQNNQIDIGYRRIGSSGDRSFYVLCVAAAASKRVRVESMLLDICSTLESLFSLISE